MRLLIKILIRLYQLILSPQSGFLRWIYLSSIFNLNPGTTYGCRFEVSCSNYCLESISNHGLITGLKMFIKRLSLCR